MFELEHALPRTGWPGPSGTPQRVSGDPTPAKLTATERATTATLEMTPLRVRVYLEDTDAGGIVYHASYLRFLERTRTEYLRGVGLEQSSTFALDVSFVVHSMTLDFHKPAGLDAELDVTCDLLEAKGARLVFHQLVRDASSALVHVSARVTVACISLGSKRPRRLPPEVLAAMDGVSAPG